MKDLTNLFARDFYFTQYFKDGSFLVITGIDINDALNKHGLMDSLSLDYYKFGV